jgi:hypothetical protein
MGYYSKKCPNLPTLPTKKNVGSFTQRFSIEEKDKTQVHLIQPMNERQKKTLIGLKRNFKILENVINVMAQTKRSMENTTHFDANVKRFKEMAKAPKEKKKNRR